MSHPLHRPPRQPPFYALIHLDAKTGANAGQYAEAVAVLTSIAMLTPGFLRFDMDRDNEGNSIRIAYFRDLRRLQAWLHDASTLLPWTVKPEDVVSGVACLWPWLADEHEQTRHLLYGNS